MHIDKRDLAKEIIFFFIRTILAFAYCFVMLMIISFMTVYFLPLKFETIIVLSIIGTILYDIYYILKKVKQHSA